ncbi:hypothetical protein [Streptomyces sp. NPDC058247]|uniref:hypothetical protein n=1 Tax=Streptomyces sp. NPDC058247 TaxID=3346401 RepID=UPI0036E729D8
MGRREIDLTVTLRVSDHNSEQDETDEALARELAQRIKVIAEEARYEEIVVLAPHPTDI